VSEAVADDWLIDHEPPIRYETLLDYIHWNPVKHGWVIRVRDWPYSSFHGCVERGLYPADWAGADEEVVEVGEWD
jgi:putative transposase